MKLGTALAVLLVLTFAVVGIGLLVRSSAATQATAPAVGSGAEDAAPEPVPSKTGPHPKAVIPETDYNFGIMRLEETLSHEFVIKNEGAVPLVLGKAVTTCKCTVANEAKQGGIPPGGQDTVTLEWTPKAVQQGFNQKAVIRTNDPALPEFVLKIEGHVDTLLHSEPAEVWEVGEITGDQPVELSGAIYSRLLDTFNIKAITPDTPTVTATAEPMPPEQLTTRDAKAGYTVHVTLAPGVPVGRFKHAVTVTTDVEQTGSSEVKFRLQGTCHGPLHFLPTPGVQWNAAALAIDLGRFPAAQGTTASLMLFVAGMPEGEELKLTSVETTDSHLEAKLQRDQDFKSQTRQKYLLTFRVPPGSPPVTHLRQDAATVTLHTNHPQAGSITLRVEMIATS